MARNDTPPFVSVIILAFQQPDFLNAALQSISAQTYANSEILIVDDASGLEFTSRYQLPPNARLIINPQRYATAAISRNIALRQAHGEYIAFLDQDDLWLPEKLAVQVAAMQAHPDALLHFTHYRRVDATLHEVPKQDPPKTTKADFLARMIYRNQIQCPSQVLMRCSAFDITGGGIGLFDESIRGAADWDMWLRAAAAGTVLADPRPLASYRQHDAQWSKSGAMVAQGSVQAMEKAVALVQIQRPDLLRLARQRHARWLRELASVQLQSGQPPHEAMTILRRSAKIWPFDPRTYGLMWRAWRAGPSPE